MNEAIGIAAALLVAFMTGLLTGTLIYERALRFAGHRPAPSVAAANAISSRVPVNTEVSAQRAITEDSIERGADEIQENGRAKGVTITRKDARDQARKMLSMVDVLGGAR